MTGWNHDANRTRRRTSPSTTSGTGELVVFLHGIGGNRPTGTEQLAPSPRTSAPSPGTRAATARATTTTGPLDFGEFSRDLLRVLDHFGARRRTSSACRWAGASRWISPRSIRSGC